MSLKLKIGDSIRWNIAYKQSDNISPVNLTGYTINVDAVNKANKSVLFNIVSSAPTSNQYITIDAVAGTFIVVIKDTSSFVPGVYNVDIEYVTADGFKTSSKTFELRVVERLIWVVK